MTNIQDPYSQSASLFSTYTDEGLLTESLNFIIPVFDNMPEIPVDKISSLSDSGKDLYYADITSSLYIRDSPGGGNIIDTIYKDDLVVILQRNYNSGWDKIQLWDGRIGYTATEYLEKFVHNNGENPSEPEIPSGGDDEPTLGDINSDGIINTLDAILVLQHISHKFTLTDAEELLADTSKDGIINTVDAIKILQYVSHKITEF